jgi:hypothetical protein
VVLAGRIIVEVITTIAFATSPPLLTPPPKGDCPFDKSLPKSYHQPAARKKSSLLYLYPSDTIISTFSC